MNFNEEQKLIKLRNRHLIVKKNVYKLFWKKKVVYIFTVYCEYYQNSSVFLQSCIIWIASTLFCFSVYNKHFLKHSTASEFEKISSSWPSSSSLLLLSSSKENCPTMLSKICSLDNCGKVGSSFSLSNKATLSQPELIPNVLH